MVHWTRSSSRFSLPSRILQPLRHLLVLCGVTCPTLRSAAPAIVPDRHVDAAVDEELHGLVVFVKHQLMQDAGRLVRAPVRVDIGAVLEKKVGDLEVVVDDGPGERGVENLLRRGRIPVEVPRALRIVATENDSRGRPAQACRPCRTSVLPVRGPRCRPRVADRRAAARCAAAREGDGCCAYVNANSMACDRGGGWCRSTAGSRSRRAIMKASRSCSAARSIKPTWNFTPCVTEQPWVAPQPADKRRQVAIVQRAHDLFHDKSLPGPGRRGANERQRVLSMKYWTKAGRPGPPSILPSELGVERDGPIQQQ